MDSAKALPDVTLDVAAAEVEAQLTPAVLQRLSHRQRGPRHGRHRNPIDGRLCTKAHHDLVWDTYDSVVNSSAARQPQDSKPPKPWLATDWLDLWADTKTDFKTPLSLPTMADITKVKLPPWTADQPSDWFEMADIIFDVFDPPPSEKQKFAVSLPVIPNDLVRQHKAQWKDQRDPYTKLKASITGATAKNSAQLYLEFHSLTYSGRPSDYARQAAAILDKIPGTGTAAATASQVKGWLIKNALEQKLPANIRPMLAKKDMDTKKLQDYTDEADKLVNTEAAAAVKVDIVHAVEAEGAVAAVKPARGGRNSAAKKSGGSSSGDKLINGLCRFHHKFGDEAYNCASQQCKKKGQVKLGPTRTVNETTSTSNSD